MKYHFLQEVFTYLLRLYIAFSFNELSNLYKVDGSIFSLNFTIVNNYGKEIALVNRKFLSIGDKYQIEILDENDVYTILTIIVAITNDIDRQQANSARSSNQ